MEQNNENLVMLLEEKLNSLLNKVDEIKESLDVSKDKLVDLDKKYLELKKDEELFKDRLIRLENASKSQKSWLLGICATIIGGILLALLKSALGV